jgi:dTDP-glucose 4,6-dehydratase
MATTVLVTGAAGFIGSNFVRFLLDQRPGFSVVSLDSLSYCGNLENLAGLPGSRHRFVRGDVTDRAVVEPLVRECGAIVHLAAETHVDRSITDAEPFVRTNVGGTHVVLEAVRRAKADGLDRRLVLVSTDEVYGSLPLEGSGANFTEESPLLPHSPYAASKAAADMLAQSYVHTYGVDVVITRSSNNLGPRQFPEKIIPLFVTNLLRGLPVPLYGDGLNVRDWLHVEDQCAALLLALERGEKGAVYNVASGVEKSNLDLTRAILSLMGRDESMIRFVADRPGHDRRYSLDTAKVRRELGWRPSRSAWPAALEETVQWYEANRAWWERVVRGEHRPGSG